MTHIERNVAVVFIFLNRVLEGVSAQTQPLINRKQAHAHQSDQTSLLHRRVSLHIHTIRLNTKYGDVTGCIRTCSEQ